MKKHISLILFTIFSMNLIAQKTIGYVTLESCNNKLDYLIKNFENQETKYLGQPISTIFSDLEIEIEGHLFIHEENVNKNEFAGLSIRFYNYNDYRDLSPQEYNDKINEGKIIEIYIKTTEALKFSDYIPLIREDLDKDWSDNMQDFYAPYIIDSIKVVGHENR